MTDIEFLAEIRRLNATPEEILNNSDLVPLILPSLRADSELGETYDYTEEAPLACPIIAFAGSQDEEETVQRVDQWRHQTISAFALHVMRGGHFFIHSNETELLALLNAELLKIIMKAQ